MKIRAFLMIPLCFLIITSSQAQQYSNRTSVKGHRSKRFVLIFCLNFPNCCDFKGQDICGMPCPPCPRKKENIYPSQAQAPTSGGAGDGGIASLLQKNPALLAMLSGAGSGSSSPTGLVGAIQSNPALATALAGGGSASPSPSSPDGPSFLANPAVMQLISEHPEVLADFIKASQTKDFVGLLSNPVIAKFVQENPDVVSSFLNKSKGPGDKPSDPNVNAALLSLAAPPPPGVPIGAFGPNIFEGEDLDVAGFDYDDEEDVKSSKSNRRSGEGYLPYRKYSYKLLT